MNKTCFVWSLYSSSIPFLIKRECKISAAILEVFKYEYGISAKYFWRNTSKIDVINPG